MEQGLVANSHLSDQNLLLLTKTVTLVPVDSVSDVDVTVLTVLTVGVIKEVVVAMLAVETEAVVPVVVTGVLSVVAVSVVNVVGVVVVSVEHTETNLSFSRSIHFVQLTSKRLHKYD